MIINDRECGRCRTCKKIFEIGALTHGNGTYLGQCFPCETDEEEEEEE